MCIVIEGVGALEMHLLLLSKERHQNSLMCHSLPLLYQAHLRQVCQKKTFLFLFLFFKFFIMHMSQF